MKSILLFLLLSVACPADVIFSNITSIASFSGYPVEGSDRGANGIPVSAAGAFIPHADYVVNFAEARFFNASPTAATVDFALFSDNAGVPGTEIGLLGSNTLAANSEGLVSVTGIPVLLQSGIEYWLVLSPGTANTAVGWEDGGSIAFVAAQSRDDISPGDWVSETGRTFQFEVNGTLAPEPTSIALLGIGAALAMYARKRKIFA